MSAYMILGFFNKPSDLRLYLQTKGFEYRENESRQAQAYTQVATQCYQYLASGASRRGVWLYYHEDLLDEYERDIIKKHERTRRDKEDDRTRHIIELRAQTGVVFLTYQAQRAIDDQAAAIAAGAPLYHFTAPDGVTRCRAQIKIR